MQLLVRAVTASAVVVAGVVSAPTGAAAATCPGSGGATVGKASSSADVVFKGHGWGHGLGMSQYGAQGAARLGCTHTEILKRYYAGTTVAATTMPTMIRLRMLDGGYRADVTAQSGSVKWPYSSCGPAQVATACVQPKGSTWQVRLNSTKTAFVLLDKATGRQVWTGKGTAGQLRVRNYGAVVRLTTYRGSSVYMDRRLRWDHTRFTIDSGTLDAIQVIQDSNSGNAMDKYLWGIAEVPLSWTNGSHEALKAQAVAARTYATKRSGRVLMPTPADQNYTGYAKEAEDAAYRDSAGRNHRWRSAVDSTTGRVVRSTAGDLIDTLYSSSFGGFSEDERYVWGVYAPFLRSVDDSRWDKASDNPYRSWSSGFSWGSAAQRLGFSEISTISVPARGTQARWAGVKVVGIAGGKLVTRYIEGWDVRQAFGMRSPGFTLSTRKIGGAAAKPIVGDWDGDGDSDAGWWRDGSVALHMNDKWIRRFQLGQAGDIPVVGDWDGNGKESVGVFRSGRWYLRNSLSTGSPQLSFTYGRAGDRPVVGSWNGTTLGIGVKRKSTWYLRNTVSTGTTRYHFSYGFASDRPVVGDWNDDGKDSIGVWRSGTWVLRNRVSVGPVDHRFRYGLSTDPTVVGDWNADGRTSIGVVRSPKFSLRDQNSRGLPTKYVTFRG
jgi:stage II sporulation protein D